MTEKGPKGKRSKEEVKAFFDWQRSYRERLFQHSETKRNWRIFALGYFLSDKFDWSDYSCFYGRERLAAELGVDVRTVTNLTKQLAKMGFIRIKRQGREKPSRYIGTIPPDVKSDAHQEVKPNAHRASGKQASMGNSTLPDVKSNSVSMCNGFPPNDSFQRTLERKGAAEAAPHNGKNAEDKLRGDGLEGRPPTGDRDEYPAAEKNPNPAGSQKQDDERERVLQAFELVKRRLNILNDPKREFVSEFQAKLDAGEPLTEADMDRLWKVYDFAFPQDEAGLMAVTEIPF